MRDSIRTIAVDGAASANGSHRGQSSYHHRRRKHGDYLVFDRGHGVRRQRQLDWSGSDQRH